MAHVGLKHFQCSFRATSSQNSHTGEANANPVPQPGTDLREPGPIVQDEITEQANTRRDLASPGEEQEPWEWETLKRNLLKAGAVAPRHQRRGPARRRRTDHAEQDLDQAGAPVP